MHNQKEVRVSKNRSFAGSLAAAVLLLSAAHAAENPMNVDDVLTTAGQAGWTIQNMGPQIKIATVMSTAVDAGDKDTSDTAYFSLMGEPGRLIAVDFASAKPIRDIEMPGAQGSYGMRVASDGNLYLASHSQGNFYRYKPGADEVENLGKPAEHVTFIWDIVEGANGRIYGGCYPKSTIFEYDIATGQFKDLGPAKEGEDYARCVAWDESRQRLYIGVGSHGDIIEYDPKTGSKKSILPEEYKDIQFIYSLGAVNGKLIARVDPGHFAIFLDAETGEEIGQMPHFTGSLISPAGANGRVYYSGQGNLYEFDPSTGKANDTGYDLRGEARGFAWSNPAEGRPSQLLIATTGRNVHVYNPAENRGERRYCELPTQALHLQNIIAGPDGNIYSSGYVSGQLGIFDPETRKHLQLGNVKQAEGVTFYNSKLFLGTYPGANLSVFDTGQAPGEDNPTTLFSMKEQGQDRPFAMLGVPEENRVFMGTVPGYGLLGGALAVYDPDTTITAMHRNIIKDQGLVTFAYKEGILYGGTTIHGGLGIEPTAKEARLFLYDIKQDKLIKEFVPVAGKRGISGLRFGPDGNLWGWAEGALFIYDPTEDKVIYLEDKFFPDTEPRHFWRGGSMTEAVDGKFYGCHYGQLFSVDVETKEVETLARGGLEIITRDNKGRLYVIKGENVLQFTPKTPVTELP